MKREREYEICCVCCPFCGKSVTAIVKRGRIHCPECAQSAPYKKELNHLLPKAS